MVNLRSWVPGLGTRWMIAASLSFSVMAAASKHLGPDIPAVEKAFWRSLFSVIATLWAIQRAGISLRTNRTGLLGLRGLLGMFGLISYFEALDRVPMGNAVTLYGTNPLFAGLFAAIFLKEKFKWPQILTVFLCLLGVFMVSQPKTDAPLLGSLFALSCGIFSGIAYSLVRGLNRTEHPLLIVLAFPLVSLPICLVWSLPNWVWPSGWQWLWLFLIGAGTQGGQVCMTYGFKYHTALRASQLTYMSVVWAIFAGVALGDDWPTILEVSGAMIIFAALLLYRPPEAPHPDPVSPKQHTEQVP